MGRLRRGSSAQCHLSDGSERKTLLTLGHAGVAGSSRDPAAQVVLRRGGRTGAKGWHVPVDARPVIIKATSIHRVNVPSPL